MENYTASDLLANGVPDWMGEDESPHVTAAYELASALLEGRRGVDARALAFVRLEKRRPDVTWWRVLQDPDVWQDAQDEADRVRNNLQILSDQARSRYERRLIQNHRARLIRRRTRGRLVDPLPVWKQRVETALLARPGTRRKSSDELSIRCIEPSHADRHPSAGWNISGGYGHCHACGASWNTKEAAALLGIRTRVTA